MLPDTEAPLALPTKSQAKVTFNKKLMNKEIKDKRVEFYENLKAQKDDIDSRIAKGKEELLSKEEEEEVNAKEERKDSRLIRELEDPCKESLEEDRSLPNKKNLKSLCEEGCPYCQGKLKIPMPVLRRVLPAPNRVIQRSCCSVKNSIFFRALTPAVLFYVSLVVTDIVISSL